MTTTITTAADKIKKRKGWSLYTKPCRPSRPRPVEPEKMLTFTTKKVIQTMEIYDNSPFSLNELLISAEGVDHSTIMIEFNTKNNKCYDHVDDDDDSIFELTLYTLDPQEVLNEKYDDELACFKTSLEKWQKKNAALKVEENEWKVWVKQEKDLELEIKLKAAKKLIKEYGHG